MLIRIQSLPVRCHWALLPGRYAAVGSSWHCLPFQTVLSMFVSALTVDLLLHKTEKLDECILKYIITHV